MQHLIQHLVSQHLPQIAAKSLLNCHVKGVHSIMFLDSPEQRIRLFVATKEHELWKNTAGTLGSLAAHAHHCDVTLHCIKGALLNLEFAPYVYGPESGGPFHAYKYVSGILNKKGRFASSEKPGVAFQHQRLVKAGQSLPLYAQLVHSVQVEQGKVCAWFVYEGREDAEYESLSYSDRYLCDTDFEGLYQPMNEGDVRRLLALSGLVK